MSVPVFYGALALSWFQNGKVKWPTAVVGAIIAMCFVAGALGSSLPQLSTLVVSQPQSMTLAYRHTDGTRRCRGQLHFGPAYKMSGRMCSGIRNLPTRGKIQINGQGNAWAMRIDSLGD